MGNSVYFFARTVGAFLGGILLMKYSESKFFTYSTYIALLGLVLMLLSENLWFILDALCGGGAIPNLFTDHFLAVAETGLSKANEVSALLIVGGGSGAVAAAARRGDRLCSPRSWPPK